MFISSLSHTRRECISPRYVPYIPPSAPKYIPHTTNCYLFHTWSSRDHFRLGRPIQTTPQKLGAKPIHSFYKPKEKSHKHGHSFSSSLMCRRPYFPGPVSLQMNARRSTDRRILSVPQAPLEWVCIQRGNHDPGARHLHPSIVSWCAMNEWVVLCG
jgi:hypothetical protein